MPLNSSATDVNTAVLSMLRNSKKWTNDIGAIITTSNLHKLDGSIKGNQEMYGICWTL